MASEKATNRYVMAKGQEKKGRKKARKKRSDRRILSSVCSDRDRFAGLVFLFRHEIIGVFRPEGAKRSYRMRKKMSSYYFSDE